MSTILVKSSTDGGQSLGSMRKSHEYQTGFEVNVEHEPLYCNYVSYN